MGKKAAGTKRLPTAPVGEKKEHNKVKKNPIFEKKAKSFRIGGDVLPKSNLTRFVKWPQYIRLQRQKRILLQRLKVPPAVAQFQHTLDKSQFVQLARLLKKIEPETRAEKKLRLKDMAATSKAGKSNDGKVTPVVKYGLNHIVQLVEEKKAKMVIIAHDVDPVELVVFLPALCRKKDVPFCVVKGKARLGQFVNKKTASCLAITSVKQEDKKDLDTLCENFKAQFNDNREIQRKMGGGISGVKSQHIMRARAVLLEKEQAKKTGLLTS